MNNNNFRNVFGFLVGPKREFFCLILSVFSIVRTIITLTFKDFHITSRLIIVVCNFIGILGIVKNKKLLTLIKSISLKHTLRFFYFPFKYEGKELILQILILFAKLKTLGLCFNLIDSLLNRYFTSLLNGFHTFRSIIANIVSIQFMYMIISIIFATLIYLLHERKKLRI